MLRPSAAVDARRPVIGVPIAERGGVVRVCPKDVEVCPMNKALRQDSFVVRIEGPDEPDVRSEGRGLQSCVCARAVRVYVCLCA